MLGDSLGDVRGKVVLRRVLPSPAGGLRTESSQAGGGTLLGVSYQESSTYESELRPDGTLFGQGQGIYMGAGGELATWIGQGVGLISNDGGVSFRGAIYLYSESEKWRRLNGVASVYEYQVNADDTYEGQLWEWK